MTLSQLDKKENNMVKLPASIYRANLLKWDNLYEQGKPEITDTEYDTKRSEFFKLYPNDMYFKTVGTPVMSKYEEIELPFIMGGLTKVENLDKWLDKTKGLLIVVSEKLDGNSIMVTWEDGVITFAASRGDGEIGQNILEKAKHFIPKIPIKEKITLRGEVILKGNKHLELGYKNRRNAVTGMLRKDQIDPKNLKNLSVIFYEVVEAPFNCQHHTEENRLKFMESLNLKIVDYTVISIKTNDFENSLIQLLFEYKTKADYDIDGLVLTRNVSERENVKYPENKVKFKVNEKAVKCDVLGIEWNVTRTGLVRPVVLIEPTEILGVTVSRATGFNWNYIQSNQIGVGSIIGVVRSGDVIPYITEVYEPAVVHNPKTCPSCSTKLKPFKNVDLICDNPDCIAKQIGKITHFFITMGAEGITERTIEMLDVKSIEQVYLLSELEILRKEGFGSIKANTVYSEIRKTLKDVIPSNLLQAFGIPMIGETTAKDICGKLKSFEELFNLQSNADVSIGDVAFISFRDNIKKYQSLYYFLITQGLVFEEKEIDSNLLGKIFVLTGNGPLKRNIYKKLCEKKGGLVKNGVTKDTDYLVTDNVNSGSGKNKDAKKYDTKVITYDQFGLLLNM